VLVGGEIEGATHDKESSRYKHQTREIDCRRRLRWVLVVGIEENVVLSGGLFEAASAGGLLQLGLGTLLVG
jgi:hypothetical protein